MSLSAQLLRVSAALTLTLSLSHSVSAEIYKWTDAQGNTHYSQTPSQGQENKATDVKNIATDIEMAAGTLVGKSDTASAEPAKSDEMKKAEETGKKNMAKHKSNCEKQKSALKQLLANPVIRWKSGEEERILTASERQEKIDEFSSNIKEMCNKKVLATKDEDKT